MNHAIPFDTYESANILLAAGVPELQVKAQIEVIKKNNTAINSLIDNSLATKTDLKREIELIRNDIALIHKDITWIKIVGSILGSIATLGITAILTILVKHL
jgi:hypothetical protein